jgi:hypothetical protein
MSKIDFNEANYGHRLMLALAIRDYTNTPGQSATGRHEGERKSLLKELEDSGCATSKAQIDRIVQSPQPGDRANPYPRNARQIALFLKERGYFPPGQDVDKTLKTLPLFFDGFASSAPSIMAELAGTYQSYTISSIDPDVVLLGELSIETLTDWNYARTREVIVVSHKGLNTLIYEGIAFSDEEKNLYILSRERNHRHPRFYLFEDCDRPAGDRIETVYGTLLGGARLRKRHFSPIVIDRAMDATKREFVPRGDRATLPPQVQRYLFGEALSKSASKPLKTKS